jgi:hypothetical protein
MRRYEIRRDDVEGTSLGVIRSDSYFGAASLAARRFFKGDLALRVSGWDGYAGHFRVVDPLDTTKFGDRFYVEERP